MNTGAIDPGKQTGVALFFEGVPTPVVAKLIEPSAAEIHTLLSWMREHDFTTLIIEDQHLPRDRNRLDWPGLKRLILSADRWVAIGELLGFEIVRAIPPSWQGPMHRSAPKKHATGAASTTKQRSKCVVSKTWTRVRRFEHRLRDGERVLELPTEAKQVLAINVPHDICDAILIGRWWLLYGSKR